MPSINSVILCGNVTREVEIKYIPNGTAVAELSLALNEKYKTQAGEQRESVTFVECALWGRTAEVAGEYVKKGSLVMIEGKLMMDTWDDKSTGQKRSKLRVRVSRLHLMGAKPAGDNPQAGLAPVIGPEDLDEIPF